MNYNQGINKIIQNNNISRDIMNYKINISKDITNYKNSDISRDMVNILKKIYKEGK